MQEYISYPTINQEHHDSGDKPVLEGRWNGDQHIQFLKAVLLYGKDWKKVEEVIDSRTGSQVRSHAQKFFLKISKINKERRRHKNKPFQLSETQKQILSLFTEQDITESSPPEIAAIIRKQFHQSPHSSFQLIFRNGKNSLLYQQKPSPKPSKESTQQMFSLNQEKPIKSQEKMSHMKLDEKQPDEQSKRFDRVLEQIKKQVDLVQEDQSFFMHFVKKNVDHFQNGGQFSDLIDFGKNVAQCEQTSPRKCSFSQMDNDQPSWPGQR